MSDFSDLCPLFNTGVYGEIALYPYFTLASRSTTALLGNNFSFGRSVIVTQGWLMKLTDISTTAKLTVYLNKAASAAAARTAFASFTISGTVATQVLAKWLSMTTTSTTFSASDVISIGSSSAETNAKYVSIMVQYKEK